jgi:hypothetical protein
MAKEDQHQSKEVTNQTYPNNRQSELVAPMSEIGHLRRTPCAMRDARVVAFLARAG